MSTSSPVDPLLLAQSARAALASRRALLDAQNVFPVPDGDTGSNLLRTTDAVVAALLAAPPDTLRAASDAALLGARGNSGSILAALLRGFDAGVERDAPLDAAAVRGALGVAAEAAYGAVAEPVEGTILTVARALAAGAHGDDAVDVLRNGLAAARVALAETPEQLSPLREAGVEDAGAAGLVALIEGVVAALEGHPFADDGEALALEPVHVADPSSRYRYCISFVVRDCDAAPGRLRALLAEEGDSIVVVGDARLLRVHVHADDPTAIAARIAAHGAVEGLTATDMREQIAERAGGSGSVGGVALVYDSTADLPTPERDSWRMIPLTVHFEGREVRDYVDLPVEEFYARLPTAIEMPRTSQPSPGAFAEVYRDLLEDYDHVVSIHISSKMSGTVASARAAARDFPGRVTVIDSLMVSALLALGVVRAQEAIDRGVAPDELEAVIAEVATRSDCIFSVPTLEYLQRNGRIGRAQALVGNVLGLQPILAIEDGEVAPARRVRGEGRVLPAMVDELVERSAAYPEVDIAIAHAADPERAAALERLVREARPGIRSVRTLTLGTVIGTHAGPGALGLAYAAPVDGGSSPDA